MSDGPDLGVAEPTENILKRYLLSALTLSLIAGLSHAGTAGAAKASAKAPGSGIAVEYIEPAVRVQDDFFTHMNGKWLKATEIPADKSSWGTFEKMHDDVQPQLRGLIENAAKGAPAAGSDAQRIGDFYASYMDEKKVESLGMTPLNAELARIAALKDKSELPAMMAHLGQLGVNVPYDFGIHLDAKDSTKYVADLSQGGLGLPDRDYFLKKDDAKLAEVLAKYQVHVGKMLALAGDKNAAANAKAIVAFETELAKVQWTKVENRDPVKTYNKVELAKMAEIAPGYDWKSYLDSAGISPKVGYVIVSQPSYLKGFAELSARTPLDTWKAYLQMHLISAYANFLSPQFVEERFDFYGRTLSGVTEMQPRWKRAVNAVEASLGESLGKLYVEQYFPAERKARMEAMVKNLLAAYKQSIDKLDWMSPATKKEAQAKLAKFTPKIGYPNRWKDYSALVVKRDDLVGNVMRSRVVESNRELNKLGRPIDRYEWGMTQQTINAY
ncbi:MAG: peptidase, partial [Massilia sp.]|nr:peptidase [Massilia sp.]